MTDWATFGLVKTATKPATKYITVSNNNWTHSNISYPNIENLRTKTEPSYNPKLISIIAELGEIKRENHANT